MTHDGLLSDELPEKAQVTDEELRRNAAKAVSLDVGYQPQRADELDHTPVLSSIKGGKVATTEISAT